jgi:hypothetical protein
MRRYQCNKGEPEIVLTNLRENQELPDHRLKGSKASDRYKAELKFYASPIVYFVINKDKSDSLEWKQQEHARLLWDMKQKTAKTMLKNQSVSLIKLFCPVFAMQGSITRQILRDLNVPLVSCKDFRIAQTSKYVLLS